MYEKYIIKKGTEFLSAMKEAQKHNERKYKMTRSDHLEPGDIIGIKRYGGAYEHYAVYIGNDRVIHYAGEGGDFSDRISIHEAPMEEFLKDDKSFFVLEFPESYGKPSKHYSVAASVFAPYKNTPDMLKTKEYRLYSPEETVKRAKSRLGETKYNLLFGNCEHFAIWCKTGISESHQVNAVLRAIYPLVVEIVGEN